jgi:hypothetical protein
MSFQKNQGWQSTFLCVCTNPPLLLSTLAIAIFGCSCRLGDSNRTADKTFDPSRLLAGISILVLRQMAENGILSTATSVANGFL